MMCLSLDGRAEAKVGSRSSGGSTPVSKDPDRDGPADVERKDFPFEERGHDDGGGGRGQSSGGPVDSD